MLTRLILDNFRGFEKHELPFSKMSVVVGKNNAGKSTVVEALRLVSIVTSRYRSLSYGKCPKWLNRPARFWGASPSLKNIEINFDCIFHRYQEPPSTITAEFSDSSSVTIYIAGEDKIFAVIHDSRGRLVKSRQDAWKANLPNVAIMPQVTPLNRHETILSPDYVKASASSSLASSHFRNQLNIYFELFTEFQEISENTWPGVQVLELIGQSRLPGKSLHLQVRNEDFVAEVAAMGHGLQMWLQTIWFLTRSKNSNTVILDEPDVYMHADLQRRIIRYLRNKFPQVMITTHSVEIMSEVLPEEILIIDRKSTKSQFASSIPAVQSLIDNVGSVHNLHLIRLWHARRFILVEGKDLKLIKQFQNILIPDSEFPIDAIPNMPIGGWGGWSYAVGSSMVLQNALGEKIKTYCLLDSDYHTEEELTSRMSKAEACGVELHIWTMKEIENYLIIPSAIHRVVSARVPRRVQVPTVDEIESKVHEIVSDMQDIVFDGLATEILSRNRKLGSGGANKAARKIIAQTKKDSGSIFPIVSGKALISRLSQWCQSEFGVSFSAISLSKEILYDEVPDEVKRIVNAIEYSHNFS